MTKIIPTTIDRTETKPNNKLPACERRDELLDSELDTVTGGRADPIRDFEKMLQDIG